MAIAIVLVLLVIISLVFHFTSPWWFTPLASNWHSIDNTINIALWVLGIVFVVVSLFLAYVVYKYRHNKNRRADYEPENKKLETWLTVITALGVAAMLAPGLAVWAEFIDVPDNAQEVDIVGQQWHWQYRFPGDDGVLGKTAIKFINESNPFGIDPNDVHGQDDRLVFSNELRLPIDQPIKALLRSKDVLHNFAVPQFRVKMDLVPGLVSYMWFTPTKIGRFEVLCEELCGIAHYTMRGHVVVESQEDHNKWLRGLPTFAQSFEQLKGNIENGKQLYSSCVACHGSNGEGIESLNGPKLAGLNKWYLERQLNYFKENVRGQHPEDPYGQQMAAMASLLPDEKAIQDVSAYLASLKSMPSDVKVSASERGAWLYRNCAYCHGKNAEGNFAMNAPKLLGQESWYLKRQILNYQKGIRGRHQKDQYGNQMIMMAKTITNETDIDLLLNYIKALETQSNDEQTKIGSE